MSVLSLAPHRRSPHRPRVGITEVLVAAGLIDTGLHAEMAAPRAIGEDAHDYLARTQALADITDDAVDDYIAGGGDEWWETDSDHQASTGLPAALVA